MRRSGSPAPAGRVPVLIDLPIDVQKQEIEWDSTIDEPLPVTKAVPSDARVERALELLLAAERPLLLAGGGVILGEASAELLDLAEFLQIPIQATLMGKGAIDEDHPLYAGMTGIQTSQRYGNASFLESDLVLALGARFGDRHTGDLATYRGDRKFIHVDVEPTQIGKVFGPDLGIVADTKLFLQALLEKARARGPRGGRRVGRPLPGAQADPAAARGLRHRAGQGAAGVQGDQRVLRPGHLLRHGHRALPDLVRPAPEGAPAAALPGVRPGRSARLGDPGGDRREEGASRTPRSSASSATTRSSSSSRSSRSAPSTTCRSC